MSDSSSNQSSEDQLVEACKKGDLSAVKKIVLAGNVDVNCDLADDKQTPLHLATDYFHKDLAEFLLSNGAKVNATDEFGNTPLHIASRERLVGFMNLLIDNGADPTIVNGRGDPAFFTDSDFQKYK